MWRQLDRELVVLAPEREAPVSHPAGERGHREGAPRHAIDALCHQELSTVDDERGQPATADQIHDGVGPRCVQVELVRDHTRLTDDVRVIAERNGQRPAALGGNRREPLALGDELLGRRRRPEDLLVEPGNDRADRLTRCLPLPLGHQPPVRDAGRAAG